MIKDIKTYRGVFLNINKSDICCLRSGMYFYFCSLGAKNHFEKYLDEEIRKKKEKLLRVLENVNLVDEQLDMAITINYYKNIEKRGFRIETISGKKIKNGYLLGDVEFFEES